MLKTAAGDIVAPGKSGPRRFLRVGKVVELTGLPPSTLYQQMADGLFPKSVPLGPRIKAWLEDEVIAWQEARIAGRDAS